jgi:hypothetical protein
MPAFLYYLAFAYWSGVQGQQADLVLSAVLSDYPIISHQRLTLSFECWDFVFIPREQNFLAHKVARWTLFVEPMLLYPFMLFLLGFFAQRREVNIGPFNVFSFYFEEHVHL